jgi:hypothetical protein
MSFASLIFEAKYGDCSDQNQVRLTRWTKGSAELALRRRRPAAFEYARRHDPGG